MKKKDLAALFSAPLWIILTGAGLAVSFLPRRAELWLGPKLGRLVFRFKGFKYATVSANIRHCFPELSPEDLNDLCRRNYEHYGILFFEFLHFFSPLPGHFRNYMARNSRFEHYEYLKKARDKGKGVIVFSSHVGFWETTAAAAGLAGVDPTVVTTVLKPAWLHRKIAACRDSCGVHMAYHPGSMPTLMRVLRKGGSIAFMNDQYAGPPMGMPVPFFGVKVDTLAAVGPLALRTGAAIVPVSAWRDADGISHVVVEPELELEDALADTEKTTTILAAHVEGWVRRHPDQWLWIHRRFKHVQWPDGK